ncbi:hypothetical protein BDN70DRAFT_922252 [Pholiota conissans]|uniref:Uncharacterized protein n=1 Tax=Pholiota conissans TaxID=109636 RepID=A0A9P5Z0B3_9AGAR|nr:hypothetical protein BDN70DRAFT_922252 [Pholiota conissans]
MPFLSKKHDNNNRGTADIDKTFGVADAGGHHQTQPTTLGAGDVNTLGQMHGSGPGANYNNDNNFTGTGQHGASQPLTRDDPYAATDIGSGHLGGASGIPPAGAIDHGTSQTRSSSHGSGGRLAGKIESAIGTMLGSDALKAKGLQKENEANSIKLQGRELAEAERLEREALMRRERAVAHGADPANSTLGAGNPAVGSGHGLV